MLKLTKKADYGLMAMKHLAEFSRDAACSAKDIAEAYDIPPAALAKILQRLVKAGLLASQHGTNGGYALARHPRSISALEVIKAIDGPLFITSCVTHRGECYQTSKCTVREPLRKVNESIQQVLDRINISDMTDDSGSHSEPSTETEASPGELVGIRSLAT
ncbi:MAG: SUF system Fe-S cluster assembly regulator [Terriglobales bacterium]